MLKASYFLNLSLNYWYLFPLLKSRCMFAVITIIIIFLTNNYIFINDYHKEQIY